MKFPKLPPLAPKPGYVIGRIVDMQRRPVTNVLKVDSIYQSFTRLSGGSRTEDYGFTFLVLYTNGLVYQGGSANFERGPAALDLANESVREFDLGTYRAIGDQIHIAWSGAYTGKTAAYRLEGDRLDVQGALGIPFRRLPKVDGLRLQGTYFARGGTPGQIWITFAADGTFRDQGVVDQTLIYFLARGLQAPEGGSGTYTIQDWTLTLRYVDGLTVNIFFFIFPDDDLRRPRQVLLNTYFYELGQ